jgi:hypothetical protein
MKNAKQFFKVFLTSIFLILAFVGCNNTSDVDGVYVQYRLIESTGELKYPQEIEFKSGKFKTTDEMGREGTFKIISEDVIEMRKIGAVTGNEIRWKVRLIRDENNKVIKMDEEEPVENTIYLRKSE